MDLSRRTSAPRFGHAAVILGLYGAVAALGLVIGAVRGRPNVYFVEAPELSWKLAIGPLCGVAVALVIVFLTRLAVHQFEWARHLHRSFRGLLGNLHARDIFILAIASSVGEELLFRGALMPWLGIWGSSAVFALLHIGPGIHYLPWTFSAFVIGLLFGGLTLLTGDLGAPIAAHFLVNYLNLNYIVRVELPEAR